MVPNVMYNQGLQGISAIVSGCVFCRGWLCVSRPVGDPTAFVGGHIASVCNYKLEKGVATGLGVFLESLLPLHVCRSATRGHSRLRTCIDEVDGFMEPVQFILFFIYYYKHYFMYKSWK